MVLDGNPSNVTVVEGVVADFFTVSQSTGMKMKSKTICLIADICSTREVFIKMYHGSKKHASSLKILK